MPDIKLFRLSPTGATELPGQSAQVEKTLQTLFEGNLESLLGVRFLATEYSTGKVHGGRIDTLGIDENGCPVIIEYKRSVKENVINQGLFYLDWLLDHKKEFQWLVLEKLGQEAAQKVDWSGPRLLCIAGDFTRYDEHAIKQINRNIELIRYRYYGDDLLLIEKAGSVAAGLVAEVEEGAKSAPVAAAPTKNDIVARYNAASPMLKEIYQSVESFLTGLGDDVEKKVLQNYFAFRRIKNFACVEVHPQAAKVVVFVKVDPKTLELEDGFTRDVSNIGHFGTGDLEITLKTAADFQKAQPLMMLSYEWA